MSIILQLKAMILTNSNYSQEARTIAGKLLDSYDADIEENGPYEPSETTEELLEAFDKALIEDNPIDVDPTSEEKDDDDNDEGITRDKLLEGFDDTGEPGT